MRYLRDIPHSFYKISLYKWNGKYIVKIEAGGRYEQTFKVDETDLESDLEVDTILDAAFMAQVKDRFDAMHTDWTDSLKRNEIIF